METPPSSAPRPAERPSFIRDSIGFKVFVIAALVVLLLVPMLMLQSLISERQRLREAAQQEVSSKWGQSQTVSGVVLSVPYATTQRLEDGREALQRGYVHFLPDRVDAEATLDAQVRRRDIYEVVLYSTGVVLTGRFGALDARTTGIPGQALDWSRAVASIGISDLTGLKSLASLTWDGQAVEAQPGVPTTDLFETGLSFPVALGRDSSGHAFSLRLQLNGSTRLAFAPLGKETGVRVRGDWGTPSFTGSFLPEESTVTDAGFDARWNVLYLNRNYPQVFTGALPRDEMGGDYMMERGVEMAGAGRSLGAFGVRLLLPLDEYQKTMRTAEYGLLCLILTFVTIFFVEILGKRRTHPLQYLLVGCAVALFYLLLLSFAEYMRFNMAYVLAALSVLSLILLYTRAIFHSWRYAAIVTALLVVFYGYFFVLLQAEAYALLLGSLGLLLILGIVMYVSRNVDWYALSGRGERNPQ